jgi:hypothetical protein
MHSHAIQAQLITIFALLKFFRFYFVLGVTLAGCQYFPTIMSIEPLGVFGVSAGRLDAGARRPPFDILTVYRTAQRRRFEWPSKRRPRDRSHVTAHRTCLGTFDIFPSRPPRSTLHVRVTGALVTSSIRSSTAHTAAQEASDLIEIGS